MLPSITTFTSDRRPPAAYFRKRLTQTPGQDVSPESFLPFANSSSNLAIPKPRRDPVRHGLFLSLALTTEEARKEVFHLTCVVTNPEASRFDDGIAHTSSLSLNYTSCSCC